MIVCRYREGFVRWEPGPKLEFVPLPELPDDAADAELDRLKLAFSKPADAPASVGVEPNIADGFVSVEPGSADHARAVMHGLAGVVFMRDDG